MPKKKISKQSEWFLGFAKQDLCKCKEPEKGMGCQDFGRLHYYLCRKCKKIIKE